MHIDEMRFCAPAAGDPPGCFYCVIDDEWAQGRTLFGGLQAMLAVRAMRLLMPSLPALWSLHTTFVAPIAPGRIRVQVELLRQGKTAIQMSAKLMDGVQVAAIVVAAFGAARESALCVKPVIQPAPQNFDAGVELPFIPALSPAFTQHYAYSWLAGGLPFSGGTEPNTRIKLRQRDVGTLNEDHIVALADAIPPVALSLVQGLTQASTLSWSLEFVRHPQPVDSALWWRVDATLLAARDGYSNQDAHLYGPDGELIALSRQVVAVFG